MSDWRPEEPVTLPVCGCCCCGGDHLEPEMEFVPLPQDDREARDMGYTHRATCPKLGGEVLLKPVDLVVEKAPNRPAPAAPANPDGETHAS